MKPQRLKDVCFMAIKPVAYVNHIAWGLRLRRDVPARFRRGEKGELWLNMGSGAKPHPKFVNIDGNILRRPDMWLDLRNGLPFPSGSVRSIYACHVIEHFYWRELLGIIAECFRVLQPSGGIRVLVPSLELACEAYVKGDKQWFPDFPTEFNSLGGRFMNFLFCDGQHRLAFDYSLAAEILKLAGFTDIQKTGPRMSRIFAKHVLDEAEPAVGYIDSSLVVEAIK
jgi:prepilin-type processing-associated H-X9-DG protein